MLYFSITAVLAALSTVVPLTVASTVPATDPTTIDAPLKWTGPSKDVNVTLYGTASEVAAQLKELNPSWAPLPVNTTTHGSIEHDAGFTASLKCCPVANWNWQPIPSANLVNAADQLNILAGSFEVQSNVCQLAECYDGAGIWICVNGPSALSFPPSLLASYAQDIAKDCSPSDNLCGQQFSAGGWNVIAHGC